MDHTQLECLQRCEQETVFRHIRHLTSAEESIGAFFGRVVHEGVRVLYDAEMGGIGGGRLGAPPACPTPRYTDVGFPFQTAAPIVFTNAVDAAAAACYT